MSINKPYIPRMNLKPLAILALPCLAILLTGCVTVSEEPSQPVLTTIGVGSLAAVGAPGVRTFSIMPNGRIVRTLPGAEPARTVAAIDQALTQNLQRNGYLVVPTNVARPADRIIAYAAGATGTLDDESLNRVFGLSPGLDNNQDQLRGAIVVAIMSRTGEVIWRGAVGAELDDHASQSQRLERFDNAIATLLRNLPHQSSR